MDVLNEQYYLPSTMREILHERNRIYGDDDSFFLRLFPMKDRVAMQNNFEASRFANGYVPSMHLNLLNSKILPTINKKLLRKICTNVSIGGETDDLVKLVYDSFINYRANITQAVNHMLVRGESVISIDYIVDELQAAKNRDERIARKNANNGEELPVLVDGKIKTSIYPLSRYKLEYDEFGRIKEARLYKNLFDGNDKYQKYVLLEHRFLDTNNQAKLEYKVVYAKYNSTSWDSEVEKNDVLNYDVLPKNIKDSLGDTEINKPKDIKCLGVYRLKNTDVNDLCPYSEIGMSQYIDTIDDVVSLDTSKTYREMDKHIGRGRVMTPQLKSAMPRAIVQIDGQGKRMDYQSTNGSMLDYTFMQPFDNVTGSTDAKPQAVQFDLRTEQWSADQKHIIGEICTKCGLSVFDYDPTMVQGVRTAREVDELTDLTRGTVEDKRSAINYELQRMLDDAVVMLGLTGVSLYVKWDKSTTANVEANTDITIKMLNNKLISRKTAVENLNPNWNKEEVAAELERIQADYDMQDADQEFANL